MAGASPLVGRRIVVTRPPEQAEALCRAIETRGARVERIPVMLIEPIAPTAQSRQLIDTLDAYALAFFVSVNAVRFGLAAVAAQRDWPPGVAVATVGPGSERALHAAGFESVVAPQAGFDSEAVLALPEFSADRVAGQRIVIFRGNGGRDLLGDTLQERGATVDYLACYRRQVPDAGGERLLALADGIDAIVLTSSEGVDNLMAMLGDGAGRLRHVPIISPHPRICARARAAGFVSVIETGAGDAGLVTGMENYFRGR